MIKRLTQLFAVLLLTLFLAACGNQADNNNANDGAGDDDQEQKDDDTGDNDQSDDKTSDDQDMANNSEQSASDQDMIDKMDELDYAELEIEVDYGKNNEYEAEIEQDKDKGEIESELEDEVKDNIDIRGEEAFDKIYPNVKSLTIDRDTAKEDAIDEVLQAFDLDSDYEAFELEITFQDGTKLEFEDRSK